MVGDQPLDGKWNFDHNNRNQYKNEVPIPFPLEFHKNVSELIAEIEIKTSPLLEVLIKISIGRLPETKVCN